MEHQCPGAWALEADRGSVEPRRAKAEWVVVIGWVPRKEVSSMHYVVHEYGRWGKGASMVDRAKVWSEP